MLSNVSRVNALPLIFLQQKICKFSNISHKTTRVFRLLINQRKRLSDMSDPLPGRSGPLGSICGRHLAPGIWLPREPRSVSPGFRRRSDLLLFPSSSVTLLSLPICIYCLNAATWQLRAGDANQLPERWGPRAGTFPGGECAADGQAGGSADCHLAVL